MRAHLDRDAQGFWTAYIEEDREIPENCGTGAVHRRKTLPVPLKVADRRHLFEEWCERNPKALREIELTALAIDARGLRVSTKYLIEKQRYEGTAKLVGVPFVDDRGNEHTYGINNSDSSLLARWLLERHPKLRIELRMSMFDKERKDEA